MKSIKPGRGPSMMSGIMCIVVGVFGIFWTIAAVSMGAGLIFGLFGIMFVGVAVVNAIYNFKNATNKNRYSTYDIVDQREESDPFEKYIKNDINSFEISENNSNFCPYCGAKVEDKYEYCNKCGKKLP